MAEQLKEKQKPLWKNLHLDLEAALTNWDELTQSEAGKKAPDEKQIEEIRHLLKELKTKLQDFDNNDEI